MNLILKDGGSRGQALRWLRENLEQYAGMIERAAGNTNGARDYLRRSLALNPQFDPLQAQIARNALEH